MRGLKEEDRHTQSQLSCSLTYKAKTRWSPKRILASCKNYMLYIMKAFSGEKKKQCLKYY
ncbi:rCG33386 [Rattus norvegicus]|uniref:RCG33386 n=1 Tax=Rattus norvegicus TaxID=10116 RepID=A6HI96_RAT|nr:rCG33386 [Rattus norvegicus]